MRNIALLLLTGFLFLFNSYSFAQAPEKFNYQAVLRNSSGELIADQSVFIEISIIDEHVGGDVLYTETHTKNTNAYGLVNLLIGTGTGTDDFSEINWAINDKFIQIKVNATDMGTFQLLSVPFAMHAASASNLGSENVYTGTDTLFVVKDAEGNPVFVVFPDGAKVIVEEATKGTVGGFAVSGRSPTKADETEIFHVTPDSTRIFVNDTVQSKGTVGGFAVSGRSPTKGISKEYLIVTQDSTRVYISDTTLGKGTVGGFAVSGRSPTKAETKDYFNISGEANADIINNEARILWYPKKSALLAGEVHVGSADSVGENSTALGYRTIAMGEQSQAFGYKAQALNSLTTAIGKYAKATGESSYAFGDGAKSLGQESYAFGSGSEASGLRSYALGSVGIDSAGTATDNTKAIGDYSFAFGLGSVASGQGAFALGTQDTASGDYSLAMGYQTKASYSYSTALGYKTTASNYSSTALGYKTIASGNRSTALGYVTTASGSHSTAIGNNTLAIGTHSTAIGWLTTAKGDYSMALGVNTSANAAMSTALGFEAKAIGDVSTAMGFSTRARGWFSTALGFSTIARSYNSLVIGRYNDTLATSSLISWEDEDPLFIIGNGLSNRHNALMVKKNGEIYFPDVYYDIVGTVNRDLFIDTEGKIGYISSSILYKREIENMEDVNWLYQLRPVNFLYKNDKTNTKQYGLIAEEVEEVNPLFVSYNKEGEIETVSYSKLITPMLKALQEQERKIESLKTENEELKNRLSEIEKLLMEK